MKQKTDQTDFEKRFDSQFSYWKQRDEKANRDWPEDLLKDFFKHEIARVLEEIETAYFNLDVETESESDSFIDFEAKIAQLKKDYGVT